MAEMFQTNFATLDWGIVAVYLAAIAGVGIYVERHIHNSADYLLGGRATGTALGVATLVGTELGLVTLMYASMEGFTRGFSYFIVPLLGLAVTLFLGSTGLVIGRMRRMRLTTVPEFFERRFDRRTRIVAGVICVTAGVLNMGLFPKMGATFITFATGLAGGGEEMALNFAGYQWSFDKTTVLINLITSMLIVLVILYTVTGGMVAVIVTDYAQFVVLTIGLGLGLYFCLTSPGLGWDNLVAHQVERAGADVTSAFNPFHPKSFGWTYVVWQIFVMTMAGFCWAPTASRALTTRDEQTTRRTFFLSSPGMFARMAIPGLWGIAAFCYVGQHPDLAEYFSPQSLEEHGGRAAEAMPLLIGKLLPSGLLGLLTAGLVAAFMSTHDSYLLAWSSVITQDIIAPLRRGRPLTDQARIRYTRISIVLTGLFLLVWGIWYELPDSVWTYMGVTGSIYLSGAGTALIGGMYWKRASSTGALWALCGGLVAALGLAEKPLVRLTASIFDQPQTDVAYWLNGYSLGLFSFIFCAVLLVVGSLCFPDGKTHDRVAPL